MNYQPDYDPITQVAPSPCEYPRRCPFYNECATQKKACDIFADYVYKPGGGRRQTRERFRTNERIPSTVIYDVLFARDEGANARGAENEKGNNIAKAAHKRWKEYNGLDEKAGPKPRKRTRQITRRHGRIVINCRGKTEGEKTDT